MHVSIHGESVERAGAMVDTLMGCSVPPRIEQASNRIVMSHSVESYAADGVLRALPYFARNAKRRKERGLGLAC